MESGNISPPLMKCKLQNSKILKKHDHSTIYKQFKDRIMYKWIAAESELKIESEI